MGTSLDNNMTKHEISLNEDQEKIASILAKLDNESIDQWLQREASDILEQIGHDVIHSYLNEIRKEIPTVKEFRDAGVSEEEVKTAAKAIENLGGKFEFDD